MATSFLHNHLKVTARFLPENFPSCSSKELPTILQNEQRLLEEYPFLVELAEVELLVEKAREVSETAGKTDEYLVAPGVELLEVSWAGFPELLCGGDELPEKKKTLLLIAPQARGDIMIEEAEKTSLLALKIVAEKLELRELAKNLSVSVHYLQDVLRYGVAKGIIAAPATKIVRPPEFAAHMDGFKEQLQTNGFTLQWHITQSCDLNCRHCYDRSDRAEVSLGQGEDILDQFYTFCNHYHVEGQVTFTGGNPLLHPQFFELYRAAIERGFKTALLANPTSDTILEKIVAIRMPEFYQISLEGLEEHNDYIRGKGHFKRSMKFLQLLRDRDIYSMVMLTLTKANLEQVLPLAEILRGSVDSFTFNRLAMVGEGASLVSVDPVDYEAFLVRYRMAAETNSMMRLKENLFNLVQHKEDPNSPLGGGCTGYGCGAAFNFVSILPDGQVQACRKFPSPIGELGEQDLISIYEGKRAADYRKGCSSCFHCQIRPVCGGCLAVSYGFNQNPLSDLDPYCFLNK